jgi:hypothetical protein
MTVYDHNDSPPTAHRLPCLVRGVGIAETTDPANYPPGVYPEGPPTTCPAGWRVTGSARIVSEGRSVLLLACEAIPLADLRAAALATVRSAAAGVIAANVPAPWDSLRDLATPEFAAWVDTFRAAVAAELARLETAVEAAADAAALAAIVADWPEVEP